MEIIPQLQLQRYKQFSNQQEKNIIKRKMIDNQLDIEYYAILYT